MRRGAIGKVIALMMVVGVLITVSIVTDPERSTGRSTGRSSGISSGISPVPREVTPWLDETGQWPLVGELISSSHVVRVYAANGGTVYTVCRPDGTVIEAGLSGDEVVLLFPDLDLSPIGDGGYVLMQVETDG